MQEFQKKDLIRINEMWYKVKLITWQTEVIWLVVLGVALVIAGIFVYTYRSKIFGKITLKDDKKTNKNGLVEISRTEIR